MGVGTADMSDPFWAWAMKDVVFKNNLMIPSATGTMPYKSWTGDTSTLPIIFSFGQVGWVPRLPNEGKLTDRGKQA